MRTKNIKRILTGLFLVTSLSIGSLLGIALMVPSLIQAEDTTEFWQDQYYDSIDMYNNLFGQYQSLLNTLENPLTNPVIPTIYEVMNWLAIDDTDEAEYTEYWMCGDFSAMLMVKAKTMNWRMRIAVMFWSFDGDPNYGVNTPFAYYGHAFNFIVCSDGYLYYIEPQTDAIWYWDIVEYHFRMWTEYDFTGISDTVWGETMLWVNDYSYFA